MLPTKISQHIAVRFDLTLVLLNFTATNWILLSVKSLINEMSYHSNQREPHYPSYLIHQRLKITKLKHLRQGELLAWEYRTSHAQHRINTTSSGNKHRKGAMGSHNFFGCYHNHEIKKTMWEREAKRTGTRKKSKRLFGVSFFLFNLGACLKPKNLDICPYIYKTTQ